MEPDCCPHCDASQMPGAKTCWLCGSSVGSALAPAQQPSAILPATTTATSLPVVPALPIPPPEALPSPSRRPIAPRHAGFSFSIGSLLLVMTLVAICTAVVAALPGLGILLCILLAPVLVRTAMVVKRREGRGELLSMSEKTVLAIVSLIVTLVIITVVLVAALGTFCAVCMGSYDALGNDGASLVAFIVAAAATLGVCVVMFRWVRRRYRRDVGEE